MPPWDCYIHVSKTDYLQGSIESVSVGEIKLSLRQSLVKLGVGFISKDPKLQVLICDLEIVMRTASKSSSKPKVRKPRSSSSSGRGKWMVVASIARFLSVSVTDMVVKVRALDFSFSLFYFLLLVINLCSVTINFKRLNLGKILTILLKVKLHLSTSLFAHDHI